MLSNPQTKNQTDTVLKTEKLNVYYGNFLALKEISLDIPKNRVTAFIGPSGCGKSTLLRCYNRLNDLIKIFRAEGKVYYNNQDLYAPDIDPVEVRRRIGMVFQRPNPFPKSIYDNIAFGARLNGYRGDMDELVERSLRQAALWDEVKDKLKQSGLSISGGQQQRLCIARAIAVQPDVILMDEPASALDPISTLRVEELIQQLKEDYTIVIVTHNMQQASRIADMTAFFNVEATEKGGRMGYLVEYDRTEVIFQSPQEKSTQEYVSGRFG
ncbi:phosphate ABC transporter ATP-binding protein [Trichocoleus sp. FACHB-90]|jgi:phosphate transport system ATP-binding protein|uniref:Phosphate ABC transporter ATP-binding protein PstB n=1 Tax=Funiculus sociatus GB2-A5 TaxID=2933946 RepID=A0ABV0JRF5_9CYAN|nr:MULTISPECIES: phosphate ABC transporter ATP-binding protein PstB [unclassified Trichocoleus]MBD1832702.1 phosphate ABC transporter ATP-binding protein [Cyanobacteria bacterium FACHB-472]MBD1906031.1 phosphate ABC transporter ATP-binding protein [Trichocoleus sp. FACHB-832]MBD1927476.1 phosphate ABC transporter ATP-binding protein [Trichocoleus sp. FACHB-90]MBD1931797.1 phosphate ABC transporter ATP-binding protein [Trichocoleus sp. FACHB-69]MBD2005771.1 phosphate ABC transporter ATP-binding